MMSSVLLKDEAILYHIQSLPKVPSTCVKVPNYNTQHKVCIFLVAR